jgi:hypothetical protein
MSHAISRAGPVATAEASTNVFAEDTNTSVDLVEMLYEEEVALLSSQATIIQM